jgi:hypothetical protein
MDVGQSLYRGAHGHRVIAEQGADEREMRHVDQVRIDTDRLLERLQRHFDALRARAGFVRELGLDQREHRHVVQVRGRLGFVPMRPFDDRPDVLCGRRRELRSDAPQVFEIALLVTCHELPLCA